MAYPGSQGVNWLSRTTVNTIRVTHPAIARVCNQYNALVLSISAPASPLPTKAYIHAPSHFQ